MVNWSIAWLLLFIPYYLCWQKYSYYNVIHSTIFCDDDSTIRAVSKWSYKDLLILQPAFELPRTPKGKNKPNKGCFPLHVPEPLFRPDPLHRVLILLRPAFLKSNGLVSLEHPSKKDCLRLKIYCSQNNHEWNRNALCPLYHQGKKYYIINRMDMVVDMTALANTPKEDTRASSVARIGLKCPADQDNSMEVSYSHWPAIMLYMIWKLAPLTMEFVEQEILGLIILAHKYNSDDDVVSSQSFWFQYFGDYRKGQLEGNFKT